MSDELLFAAFASAVGDVLSGHLLETKAIVEALRVKGLLSVSEYKEAKEKLLSRSAETVAASLATQLRTRMAEHYGRLRGPETIQ